MLLNLLLVVLFGYIGYLICAKLKLPESRGINVILLFLLIISFYIHADIIRIFDFSIDASEVLVGLIAGILMRRLK